MKKMVLILGIIVVLITGLLIFRVFPTSERLVDSDFSGIRYVALGDSYTIGEGATEAESWPSVMTTHLKQNGINIRLIANPSVTGWTTQDVINNELRIFDASNPNFATLLIGVNDWVQGVPKETFKQNLIIILDRMQQRLPDKSKLILVTIPDFSVSPRGSMYGNGRNIKTGISEFNEVIKDEGKRRNLPVVDIFELSQEMGTDQTLVAADSLHPSAKEYSRWEKIIYPVAYDMLKGSN